MIRASIATLLVLAVAVEQVAGEGSHLRKDPSLFFQRELESDESLEDEDAAFFDLTYGSMSYGVPTSMPTASPTVRRLTPLTTCQDILWSDEFNDSGNDISATIWSYDLGNGDNGWGNQELQDYTEDSVQVQDGNLQISTQRTDAADGQQAFTSGRIRTEDKLEVLYGTVEARIQMPPLANGLWPAFWLLGGELSEASWPMSGEIDIMEMGQADSIAEERVHQRVSSAVHWQAEGGQATFAAAIDDTVGIDFTDGDYHIFRLEWTSTSITTYADDNLILEFDISACAETHCSEFHQPHFLLLNMAVGGYFTGILDDAEITAPLPAMMKVDYVRVCDNGETVLSGSAIEPPVEYTFDCGLPDFCTTSALNNYAGDSKCGDQIQSLLDSGSSEEAACEQVTNLEYPDQCGACWNDPIDCGVPDTCTQEVLDADSGGAPCGDRISFLINSQGQSEQAACNQIAAVEFPAQCGGCTPPAVEAPPVIDCGVPDTCTQEVLDADAEGFPCGARISFLISSMGQSELDACNQVAAVEFPTQCSGCTPVAL